MPRLIWSPSAIGDLRRIDIYLEGIDPRVAVATLRAIGDSADRLRTYPQLGPGLIEPFRILNVRRTRYVIVYRVTVDGIDIVRIRHTAENWFAEIEGAA